MVACGACAAALGIAGREANAAYHAGVRKRHAAKRVYYYNDRVNAWMQTHCD